jgi:hypothetical protein
MEMVWAWRVESLEMESGDAWPGGLGGRKEGDVGYVCMCVRAYMRESSVRMLYASVRVSNALRV